MASEIIQPGDALPALFRVEQSATALHNRLTAHRTALYDVLCATGAPEDTVDALDIVHRENMAACGAVVARIRAIRHQLSRALP